MIRGRATLPLAATLVATACGGSPAPTSTPALSEAPGAVGAGNLAPGCEAIELRGPNGELVRLDGDWSEVTNSNEPMTWWIRTQGNCVWGTGYVEEVPPEGTTIGAAPHQVQLLSGLLGADFVIVGEILNMGPVPQGFPVVPRRYAPLRMLVDFDDAGGVILREDREPGVGGPRCPEPGAYCPAPLVLEPVD